MKGAEAATLQHISYDDIMRGVSYYHHIFDKLIDFYRRKMWKQQNVNVSRTFGRDRHRRQ